MKTLEIIYWLRLAFGLTATVLCVLYGVLTNTVVSDRFTINDFMNGLSIALVTYMASYYLIKFKFSSQVEKPQKLVTTGIGVYFLSWIVFWVLLYTVTASIMV